MNNLNILYEDNHVIVVVKPFNVLSQSDVTGDIDMLTLVKQYIKVKYNKPGNVYVGLVHRLDRPTSGIMVFAKTSKAASRLSEQIRTHQFNKEYIAVVHGIMESNEGTMIDYIKKEDKRAIITTENDEKTGNDWKRAELKYEVIDVNQKENLSLVDIFLITGRYNQIRVQFASRNHPLYGDNKYGKLDKNQLCLVAKTLEFIHPTTKEVMTFKIDVDKNMSGFDKF